MNCIIRRLALIIALVTSSSFIPKVVAQIETVSINAKYPHTCVGGCVYRPDTVPGGIEDALDCEDPAANNCYCATASASASAVDAWVSACATTRCGKGDISDDLNAIKSIYASYCLEAGFTQPIISEWYTPATTTSDTSSSPRSTGGASPPTTTQLTVVTQTAPSSSAVTNTQVTVHRTSTQWVDSAGSSVPTPGSDTGPNKLALRLGLGVGVPVVIAVAGVGLWLCLRKRRNLQGPPQEQWQQYPPQDISQAPPTLAPPMSPPSATITPIQRKPVPTPVSSPVAHTPTPVSQMTELPNQGIRREISGTEIHPFPIINASPPISVPGEHELHGRETRPELAGQTWTPPPVYQPHRAPDQGLVYQQGRPAGQHWELP